MTKTKQILSWGLVISWMALIFYLSHQPATESASLSSEVMENVLKIIHKVAPNATFDLDWFHHFIRKNAHFIAYLILGVLVANGLRTLEALNLTTFQSLTLALLICVLYAISDEVHQLFIPGRAGQIKDVLIDSAGAVVGITGFRGLSLL